MKERIKEIAVELLVRHGYQGFRFRDLPTGWARPGPTSTITMAARPIWRKRSLSTTSAKRWPIGKRTGRATRLSRRRSAE